MTQLTVKQLRDEATKHADIAKRLNEVADSLSNINPNVLIVIGSKERNGAGSTSGGLEQIKEVLRKAGKPMSRGDILDALAGSIQKQTLISYLSKNKGAIFTNPDYGLWGLAEWKKDNEKPA